MNEHDSPEHIESPGEPTPLAAPPVYESAWDRVPTPVARAPYPTPPPVQETALQRRLKRMGPLGAAIAAFLAKLKTFAYVGLAVIKFLKLGKILLTCSTMLLSVLVYSRLFGWPFAVGFVILLFIHEMGHVFVAWRQGLPISAPIFVPFMGAIIFSKRSSNSAWAQAIMGIGGPAAGTVGAVGCLALHVLTGAPIFLGLAYIGFFLNLFNMLPIVPLDGGWIVGAISPWIWILGLVGLIAMTVTGHMMNPLVWIIVILTLPRVWSLFRPKPGQVAGLLRPATLQQRVVMGVCYVGLVGFLGVAMTVTAYTEAHSSTTAPFDSPDGNQNRDPNGVVQHSKPVAELSAKRPSA